MGMFCRFGILFARLPLGLGIAPAVSAMPVSEHVQQRTREQEQIRQDAEDMRAMLK